MRHQRARSNDAKWRPLFLNFVPRFPANLSIIPWGLVGSNPAWGKSFFLYYYNTKCYVQTFFDVKKVISIIQLQYDYKTLKKKKMSLETGSNQRDDRTKSANRNIFFSIFFCERIIWSVKMTFFETQISSKLISRKICVAFDCLKNLKIHKFTKIQNL